MPTRGAVRANQRQAAAWNGPESVHFADHADRYDRQLEPFTQALLEWPSPRRTTWCSLSAADQSASTLAAATRAGRVTGVDFSKPLVGEARRRAQDADRRRQVRDR
jgi:hypothetical protein